MNFRRYLNWKWDFFERGLFWRKFFWARFSLRKIFLEQILRSWLKLWQLLQYCLRIRVQNIFSIHKNHATPNNTQFTILRALSCSFTSPLFLVIIIFFFLPLLAINEAIKVQYSTYTAQLPQDIALFCTLMALELQIVNSLYFFFLYQVPILMRKSENHVR